MSLLTIENVSIILFFISLYGLITSKNIIKSIISTGLLETAIVIFFLGIGYSAGNTPPIGQSLENVSDPLPQALVITAIIIGVAVTAINLTMLITLCRQYQTSEWDIVKKILKNKETE